MSNGERDPYHNLSGARLPSSPAPTNNLDDIGDPARGEKVPRCLTCGKPTELLVGTFIPDRGQAYAGRHFRYRLCLHCVAYVNGPLDPDPLTLEEPAA